MQGDFQLSPQFTKHYVSFVKWNGLSQDRQDKLFKAFLKDNGPRTVDHTVTSIDGQLTVKEQNNVNCISQVKQNVLEHAPTVKQNEFVKTETAVYIRFISTYGTISLLVDLQYAVARKCITVYTRV